jgi:hypothetical protein
MSACASTWPPRPAAAGCRLPRTEQSDLDLLQVQKVDELGDGLGHSRSLVPDSLRLTSAQAPAGSQPITTVASSSRS